MARTTRNYVEVLEAFFSADMAPEEGLRTEAAAQALSPDDLSLTAAFLRGQTMSHAAWIRTSRIRGGLRAAWRVTGSASPPTSRLRPQGEPSLVS